MAATDMGTNTTKIRGGFMNMKMRMSRRLALAGSLLVALAALPVSAFADIGMPCEGAALVIGNGKYQYPAWELSTPRNDAVQIGNALEDLGYSVTRILDADHATLLRGLTDFRHAAAGAHFAVIFYSGHASALLGGEGEYLIPVDSIPKDGSTGFITPKECRWISCCGPSNRHHGYDWSSWMRTIPNSLQFRPKGCSWRMVGGRATTRTTVQR